MLNSNLVDIVIVRDVQASTGISFDANGSNGITIYAPKVEVYKPIMSTVKSTNNVHLANYINIIGQDLNGDYYVNVHFKNNSTAALTNLKPSVRILYVKTFE